MSEGWVLKHTLQGNDQWGLAHTLQNIVTYRPLAKIEKIHTENSTAKGEIQHIKAHWYQGLVPTIISNKPCENNISYVKTTPRSICMASVYKRGGEVDPLHTLHEYVEGTQHRSRKYCIYTMQVFSKVPWHPPIPVRKQGREELIASFEPERAKHELRVLTMQLEEHLEDTHSHIGVRTWIYPNEWCEVYRAKLFNNANVPLGV